jgi:hypothetical protein
MKQYSLFLLCGIAVSFGLAAQEDFSWWNEKQQWDGKTHWRHYIILSPAFMGPNALPVPEFRTAYLEDQLQLEAGGEAHFGKGDRTQNGYTALTIPMGEKVNILVFSSPLEYYRLDTLTRDERKSRDRDSKGFAWGDLYFGTRFKVLYKKERWPDISAGMYFRAPSGGKLSAARHTDTPGYYFNVEASRSIKTGGKLIQEWTPFLNLGFYVWQVMRDDNLQNDAFLFGAGLQMQTRNLQIEASSGGYQGYFKNGDAPLVVRLHISQKQQGGHKGYWRLRLQQGLFDFPYWSARLTYTFVLNPGNH